MLPPRNAHLADLRKVADETRRLHIISLGHTHPRELRERLAAVHETLSLSETVDVILRREKRGFDIGVQEGATRVIDKLRAVRARPWRRLLGKCLRLLRGIS